MIEKQKYRRNSFTTDFGGTDDDFILADLDLMRDKEEPSPVPLYHDMDDESVIDRLLAGVHYKDDYELGQADGKPHSLAIDAISLTEELTDIDEITAEEDAIDRLLVNSGFDDNIKMEKVDRKPDARVIADTSPVDELVVEPVAVTEQNSFPETEEIPVPDMHLMADFDEHNSMTSNKVILNSESSKLALGGEEADILSVQEGYAETVNKEHGKPEPVFDNLNKSKKNELNLSGTEQETIKKLIKAYENKAKKAVLITYASLGFGFIAGKNSDLEINPGDALIERLNQKINSQEDQIEEQAQSYTDISENEMTVDTTKKKNVNKPLDKLQAKLSELENKKPTETAVKKVLAEKKPGKIQAVADWSVKLTAYDDLSYAKGKAAKLLQKGIPVKVIAVDMNKAKWYWLKVGGFKSKEEATAYAAKIKKSLNLNSVSVVNN